MKRVLALCLSVLVFILFAGCATIVTHKAKLEEKPKGFRVYPPRVYLFVNTIYDASGEPVVEITAVNLPDYTQAYDLKPVSILSKNNFNISIETGQIVSLNSNMDSTAVVEVLKAAVAGAKEAFGGPGYSIFRALGSSDKHANIKPFPLKDGTYRLDDDGVLTLIMGK